MLDDRCLYRRVYDHGHCGIVRDGKILNDETLDCLRTMARTHAQAGADMVAPSDMMDGRVGAIRDELDQAGLVESAHHGLCRKFASCFYAPFRDAANSSPQFGDRQSYQMDPANKREALREIDSGYRRRGRHYHGEAGHCRIWISSLGPGADAIADCRLSSQRRIQHDQSGRASGMAG